MRHSNVLVVVGCALSLVACPAAQQNPPEEEAVVVLPGKKDDFFAPTAQEYRVEGTWTVELEPSFAGQPEADRLARAQELVSLKQVVVGWFLNIYLIDKHGDGEEYGGFHALAKNGSYDDLELQHVGGETYSFRFRHEIGGKLDLLSNLPITRDADGVAHFDLIVGKIANDKMAELQTNDEWYRESPWSSFVPANVDPSLIETLDVTIEPEPRSIDAWLDYERLFADGTVDIGVHFGWDYHDAYHLVHSESTYDWLIAQGFESPVGSYSEYRHDSGPLTRQITFGSRQVTAEVELRWGQPGSETDPDTAAGGILLEDNMRRDFETKDVVIFSGHSGAFYGFALANWRMTSEGDLDDSEIPGLNLPTKYQVVLAEGCDTYALGQAFWENPAKSERNNLDIITTTSFSNASTSRTVTDFLRSIVGTDSDGDHQAMRFGELLTDLDRNSSWFTTMYGVHGIDDNPHLHPRADIGNLCGGCDTDADCGGQGNLCARMTDEKACAVECTADDGCPGGYKCLDIARGSWLTTTACVPDGLSCVAPDPEPSTEFLLVINEVGADPAPDLTGDWNGDGVRSATEDEFVELVNTSSDPVRIGDWTVSDAVGTRFTFPTDAVIPANGAVLVFGGGTPGSFRGVQVWTSSRGLGISNSGDVVTLSDDRGSRVDQVTFGREGGRDASLTRTTDGDPNAGMMEHSGANASPGTRSDGSDF